jgi:nucleotide-binding universal stress UspA family protein
MSSIRTVLQPTDLTDRSNAATRLACSLAHDLGARLVLLHVLPDGEVTLGTVRTVLLDLENSRDRLARARERIEGSGLRCPVETLVRRGDPVAEILKAADESHCDLIVMGTHGRSGLGRVLLGSTADAILRTAHCPVLTINPTVRVAAAAPASEPAIV